MNKRDKNKENREKKENKKKELVRVIVGCKKEEIIKRIGNERSNYMKEDFS